MAKYNKKINTIVRTLEKENILTRHLETSYAQHPIPNLHHLIENIHDEDLPGTKSNKGNIECAIDIEGKYSKNSKVINALKALNCWKSVQFNDRNKGYRFIYCVADKSVSAEDIIREKMYFRSNYMNDVSKAIITNL